MKKLLFLLSICLLVFMACHKDPAEPTTPDVSEKFLVKDTFYQRLLVFDSPSSSHLEDLPPAPQPDKIIRLEKIPNEPLTIYNTDTITSMLLIVNPADSFRVGVNQWGGVYRSYNVSLMYELVGGNVFEDSISLTITHFNGGNGSYKRNKYTGKRL